MRHFVYYIIKGKEFQTAQEIATEYEIGLSIAKRWIKKRITKCGHAIRIIQPPVV